MSLELNLKQIKIGGIYSYGIKTKKLREKQPMFKRHNVKLGSVITVL